jgi:putative lipoic acid-binding regulatory protein
MSVKKIKTIFAKLEDLQSQLNDIHATYQDTFDKKSSKWQESEKGEVLSNRISYLESALSDIDSLMANLDEASTEED